jgi:hypothetical protein
MAQDLTRFFEQFPNCGCRNRLGGNCGPVRKTGLAYFSHRAGWDRSVIGVNGTAGEHKLSWHERSGLAALPHQDRRLCLTVPQDNHRGSVANGGINGHMRTRLPKAVHAAGPLNANNKPLEAGQQEQRKANTKDRENRDHDQRVWAEVGPNHMDQRRQQVANDKNRQIGRAVVSAVMIQGFTTFIAVVCDFQITRKHIAFTAVRALAAKTAKHGGLCRAIINYVNSHGKLRSSLRHRHGAFCSF